jgi:hypothetical protein
VNQYGPPDYVKVEGRDEVAKVIQGGTNIGSVYCYALLFEATGEVAYYAIAQLTPCDAAGTPS